MDRDSVTVNASNIDARLDDVRSLDRQTDALRRQLADVADARAAIIRDLVADGVRPAEIARALGVTRQAINHMLRR